jgi:predicted acyl esterase
MTWDRLSRFCWLFLAGMLLSTAVSAQVVTPKDLEEQAKRFKKSTAMVPMRDGVKLHTIIYEPKEKKGPLPFLLMRTPYGSEPRGPKALKNYFKDLADEGYIFVSRTSAAGTSRRDDSS